MVKKLKRMSEEKKAGSPLAGAVKDSAQQIWLAGLGAFAKAQEEGGKVFEALVREGSALQRKTQSMAEDRISEATSRVTSMASDIGARAQGQWDKLETIFEERVSKAMARLNVPSAKELDALKARVAALEAGAKRAPARKAAAKRPARKTA